MYRIIVHEILSVGVGGGLKFFVWGFRKKDGCPITNVWHDGVGGRFLPFLPGMKSERLP